MKRVPRAIVGIYSKNGQKGLIIPTCRIGTLNKVQTLALGRRTIAQLKDK